MTILPRLIVNFLTEREEDAAALIGFVLPINGLTIKSVKLPPKLGLKFVILTLFECYFI